MKKYHVQIERALISICSVVYESNRDFREVKVADILSINYIYNHTD